MHKKTKSDIGAVGGELIPTSQLYASLGPAMMNHDITSRLSLKLTPEPYIYAPYQSAP